MKKKTVLLTAMVLFVTSLVFAKDNGQLLIDQLSLDNSVNEDIASLVVSGVQESMMQAANKESDGKIEDDKNWLKSLPLAYQKGMELTLAETVSKLEKDEIKITDITDERTRFDVISYLMVHKKATFKKCIDKKKNRWNEENTPLYYIADIDQGRTLFTQAVLAVDKDALDDLWNNLPGDNAMKQELLIKTLETLIKVPESEEPPLDEKYIKNRISRIEKRKPHVEELVDLADEEDQPFVAQIIDKDRKELGKLKEERNASNEKEQYNLIKQPSDIDVAYFVIDGDIQALRDVSENIGTTKIRKALAFLITHSKGVLGKK